MISFDEISAFLQVIMVDLVLAGDNAIVVGLVAAGVAPEMRRRVIFIGIAAATAMRVAFALVTTELLQIIGLTLAGGLLLLWVCWKLWREIEIQRKERAREAAAAAGDKAAEQHRPQPRSVRDAVWQIVLADVSMSLDNVLAVAGVARHHTWVLVFGLVLSVALMGAAATMIAGLLKKHHWLAYVGLVIIFYVACQMIWDGGLAVMAAAEAGGF